MNQTENDGRILRSSPGLSTASVTLGAIALLTCFIVMVSLPLGALAVSLGLLSRGNMTVSSRSRLGITLGLTAMIASSAITGYAAYTILTTPEMMSAFDEMMDYYADMYGLNEESMTQDFNEADPDDRFTPDQLIPDQDPQEAPASGLEGGSYI